MSIARQAHDGCPFCEMPPDRVWFAMEHAYAVRDLYPVSPGHTLVIPHRHASDWWSLGDGERREISALVDLVKSHLDRELSPDGYNVGFNAGSAAGQTVFHAHVHVIPRYVGDVPDPTGGVRGVRPDQADYRSPSFRPATGPTRDGASADPGTEGTPPISVEVASRFPARAEDLAAHPAPGPEPTSIIQYVLGVLDEGRRSATYKPALLMSLVELAAESAPQAAPLELPLRVVAERTMELYWPQTRPYPHVAGGSLRQTTGAHSRIIDALVGLRGAVGAGSNDPLGRVRTTHPQEFATARDRIVQTLARQPVPRLQRPGRGAGDGTQYPRFLFDDVDYVPERGWRGEGEPVIRLLPGVAEALARGAPLLRIAAQDIWTREVAEINRLQIEEQQLRAFLFGSTRIDLTEVAGGLRDLGHDQCFWCRGNLGRRAEVDHVIPWSHYPNDDLANLVLVDPACNNDKRDRLISAELVTRWVDRDRRQLQSLAENLRWPMEPVRSAHVARSAYRYLPVGVPVWRRRGHLQPFDEEQRRSIIDHLATLTA